MKTNWVVAQDPAFIAGLSPVMKCMPPPARKRESRNLDGTVL